MRTKGMIMKHKVLLTSRCSGERLAWYAAGLFAASFGLLLGAIATQFEIRK